MRLRIPAGLTTVATLALVWGTVCTASATTLNYDFSNPTNTSNPNSYIYTSGGVNLVANGYGYPTTFGSGTPVAAGLKTKTAGVDETGLGMSNAASAPDFEIQNQYFIQLDFTAPINLYSSVTATITITSVQQNESFAIWGSNTAGSLGTFLFAGSIGQDGVPQNLPNSGSTLYKYYSVSAPTYDVLLAAASITGTTGGHQTTPEPATAGLTGLILCGGVAFFQRRRSRKQAASKE